MSKRTFTEQHVDALFVLAGIPVFSKQILPNGYWPEVPEYQELRDASPWFLVTTSFGPVQIGWRKRVMAISWAQTPVRAHITDDDVTKSATEVHAWTYPKAVEYLAALAQVMEDTKDAAILEQADNARDRRGSGFMVSLE
jgi:hypothetical protein